MNYILSDKNIEDLKLFQDFFMKWQNKINLISKNSISDFWNRHILDSSQLFPYIKGKKIVDLGSGGGFPAIVNAIIAKDDIKSNFFLIERDNNKAMFLKECVRTFSLNANVYIESIENIKKFDFDIITSRALADVEKILTISYNMINKDTIYYLLKGKKADLELSSALLKFNFKVEKIPSQTNDEGCILKITDVIKKEK